MGRVVLVDYDTGWPAEFEAEAAIVREGLGDLVVTVHHVGSTSVPGLIAKPIIDVIPEVTDIEAVATRRDAMEALGYEWRGEFGLPRRRFFTRDGAPRRANVHVWQTTDPEVARHLLFRDVLRRDPDVAARYAALKRALRDRLEHDSMAYAEAKTPFITEVLAAAGWKPG